MKKTLVLTGALALGLALAASARASFVVNYSVDGIQTFYLAPDPQNPGGFLDTLRLDAGSGTLTLSAGIAQTADINGLQWWTGNSPVPDGTPVSLTLARAITLNAGNSTIIQQGVDVYHDVINHLTIDPSAPLVFNFGANGTVTVTPLAFSQFNVGQVNHYEEYQHLQASFLWTPVPEPTTIVAGALLLLPFGAGALRIVRRKA